MSEKRGKMKGKNGFLAVFFFRKTTDFLEFKRETSVKINQRIRYLHKSSRTKNLAIKLFLEGFKQDLATI